MKAPALDAAPVGGAPTAALFRREGAYWSVMYQDTTLRLRDCKGLRYIAELLQQPGTPIAARDLLRTIEHNSQPTLASDDERARLRVTKRIKAVVNSIELRHPALSYHLRTTVKTGARCVYLPDPQRPILWNTGSDAASRP